MTKFLRVFTVCLLVLFAFTACSSKEKELLGKWEELDGDDDFYEFIDSETMMDGSFQLKYKVEGDQIICQYMMGELVYEYKIDGVFLTLNRYGDDVLNRFIRKDSIKNDENEVAILAGQWENEETLVIIDTEGSMSIKGIYLEDVITTGPFIANDGLIRYEPESYEVYLSTYSFEYLYIKYEIIDEKLRLVFYDDYTMEKVAGGVEVDYIELVKSDDSATNNVKEAETEVSETEETVKDVKASETEKSVKEDETIETEKLKIKAVEMDDSVISVLINNGSSKDIVVQETGINLLMADGSKVYVYTGSLVVDEILPANSTEKLSAWFDSLNTKDVVGIEVYSKSGVLLDTLMFDSNLHEYLGGTKVNNEPSKQVLVGKYVAFNDQGVSEEYVPYIEFFDDNTFKFVVNIYVGMAESYGTYEYNGVQVACYINEIGFSGAIGDNVDSFYLNVFSEGETLQYIGETIGITERFQFFNKE